MAPVASSNILLSHFNIKPCEVPICDIFYHSRMRKQRNGEKKVDTGENSSDEEAPTVVKKRIVKINSDKEGDKENSDVGKANDSDYDVKQVNLIKKEIKLKPKVKQVKPIKKEIELKPKNGNSYEEMVERKRAERIAFLKSMEIDKIKEDISEAIGGIKQIEKTTSKVKPVAAPEPIRRSNRLANIERKIVNLFQSLEPDDPIPSEISFEDALRSGSTYEKCVHDLSIQEPKHNQKFFSYDNSVLTNMTLHELNICKVVPKTVISTAWYPSKEDLVVAAGDEYGSLGLWKMEDLEATPHLFKVHTYGIPKMQFCPSNPAQLITASYDGTMRCGDLISHTFSEIYASDRFRVTWFDFMSPPTFLISHSNGEVALLDTRTKRKSSVKRLICHNFNIRTVSVHPVNKNVFVTASKRTIRLWDLRRLKKIPIVEISHNARAVNSAYFSPASGNSILSSFNDSICNFDSTNLTEDIKLKKKIRHKFKEHSFMFRATWLPNSDDMFSIGSMAQPKRIEIFDKDLNLCHNITNEKLTTYYTAPHFHPYRSAIAVGNYSGKLFVFT